MGATQGWGDFFGSLLGIFGYNPAKARGIDLTNIMSMITNELTKPELQAQSKLDSINKRLDALLMMPLSGQMKSVVIKARNAVHQQKTKVNNQINKASILRNEAEQLAQDMANSTVGDFWSRTYHDKEARMHNLVQQAKDTLNGLKDEVLDSTKENN